MIGISDSSLRIASKNVPAFMYYIVLKYKYLTNVCPITIQYIVYSVS